MPLVQHLRLGPLAASILEGAGTPHAHAKVVADHLVGSNLVGHDSHGVLRLSQYCEAIERREVDPRASPSLYRESVAGCVLDGQRGFGQVAAEEAMSQAVERARIVGVAAITVRNCYHSGRIGAYALTASKAGMIGLVMVNAGGGGQSVTPFGGSGRRLATNPFAIAVPSSAAFDPMLDVATSMAPEGKIRDYFRRGASLPEGWIVDAEGTPSTNAADFYGPPAGALLPWGGAVGYKGFGLALMIDVIAGALSGAGCCGPEQAPASDGMFLLAIDVEQFTSGELFQRQVRKVVDYVKSCAPAPGFDEVLVPGEYEYRESVKRRRDGILIDDHTWEEIQNLASRYESDADLLQSTADGNGVAHSLGKRPATA